MARSTYHVCYHCKDRKIGCHATCELYIEEKKQMEEVAKVKVQESINASTIHNLEKQRCYTRNNRQRKVYKTHKR